MSDIGPELPMFGALHVEIRFDVVRYNENTRIADATELGKMNARTSFTDLILPDNEMAGIYRDAAETLVRSMLEKIGNDEFVGQLAAKTHEEYDLLRKEGHGTRAGSGPGDPPQPGDGHPATR